MANERDNSTRGADQSAPIFEYPIPIENYTQIALLVVSWLCIVICICVVTMRVWARRRVTPRLDGADYCTLTALFFNTALHVDILIMVHRGGFGFHVDEIAKRFGPDALELFFKVIISFTLLWCATTAFTKLSVLLLFTTLFPTRRMRMAAYVMGGFIIVWCTGAVVATLLMCQPFEMNWNRSIPGGHCGDDPLFYTILGVINIIVEVAILLLPMPVIYKLNMPLHRRLVVVGMFSLGFGTCAVTIYRQTKLEGLDFEDMTHEGAVATLLSGLEPSVALTLACIPLLRPLLCRRPDGKTSYPSSFYLDNGRGSRSGDSRREKRLDRTGTRQLDEEECDPVVDVGLEQHRDVLDDVELNPVRGSLVAHEVEILAQESESGDLLRRTT
ncbi:hypothetical protein MCOR27_010397 [Pyricularia oryzae]|uniref:Rhodopsin domain-containing protein n=2 Tax=Pyricularia TaxID=48558 RepID=A0ABQ8NT12_PYRGI|nr:hypothetical protein MCOR01_003274 [Pyricularia oryzae]KAI6301164.1 hypothetical protein MCOR33_003229 [Pyricularia grisea]KAH9432432.1 hypothetical protein MCOR02_007130 [Pyricularia oryzae]KAI6254054.1 hypothetical protein MCOR19_009432 [Pyricularia oryzae]KAI6265503.1 hypothetical protein MCOR26_010696 [Pyricularia oryzae]